MLSIRAHVAAADDADSRGMTPNALQSAQERPVPPAHLAWLESELDGWRAAGVIDDAQAAAIRGRYVAVRRFSLLTLLLWLGGAFVGVGVLWLVAANLEGASPLTRFVVVTLLWLGFVAAAETLAARRRRGGEGSEEGSPLVGALRLLAALCYGAVVFQAAQSLQVPADAPGLVGFWGLGALLYAYACGGVAPLLVGISAGTGWFVWVFADAAGDGMGFVLPVLLAGAVTGAVAVFHARRWRPAFAATWRESSALLALIGLFVAALPYVATERFSWSAPVLVGIGAALASGAAAVAMSSGRARFEAVVPLLVVAAGALLVWWEPPDPVRGMVGGEGYAHAFVSVAAYVGAAAWYAVLGVFRDSGRLTFLAAFALVLFTTVQSFAVFSPIVTGATLFLLVGSVLLGTGALVSRGRRHLMANLEGASR